MPKKRQQRSPRAVPPTRISWGPSANPALREASLAIVDQQLRDTTPPETRRLIGNVVAQEIFAVMQRGEVYNEQRYIVALQRLPNSAV